MILANEAAILAATLTDRMTLRRQQLDGRQVGERVVYQDMPCALSRSAHTASPAPAAMGAPLAEGHYRMSLFMPVGTVTRIGDRVDIRRGVQRFAGSASDSMAYPSHSVCVVDVREVAQLEEGHGHD